MGVAGVYETAAEVGLADTGCAGTPLGEQPASLPLSMPQQRSGAFDSGTRDGHDEFQGLPSLPLVGHTSFEAHEHQVLHQQQQQQQEAGRLPVLARGGPQASLPAVHQGSSLFPDLGNQQQRQQYKAGIHRGPPILPPDLSIGGAERILEGFNAGVPSGYTNGADGDPVDREGEVGGFGLPDGAPHHTARNDDTGDQDQQDQLQCLRQQQQLQYRQQSHPPTLPPADYLQVRERGTQAKQPLSRQERAARPPPLPRPSGDATPNMPIGGGGRGGGGGGGGRRGPGGGVGKTQLSSSTSLPRSQPLQQRQESSATRSVSGTSGASISSRGHPQGVLMAGPGSQNQEGTVAGAYCEDMQG